MGRAITRSNVKIILDTRGAPRCHKCLTRISDQLDKIVIGQWNQPLEVYHRQCYEILHPERHGQLNANPGLEPGHSGAQRTDQLRYRDHQSEEPQENA